MDTITDPRALVTKFVYDALGRRSKEIKNYDSGVNSGNPYGTDQNVTVSYAYADGLRTSLTAVMPSGGGSDQVTTYTYGTVKGTNPGDSLIATGHLLQKVTYPDSASGSDVVTYAYNAQVQEIFRQDQAGNILESVYDDSGRRTINKATTIISGWDGDVKRVENAYDSLGRPSTVIQYNATSAGSPTDGVAYTYDNWGNVASYTEDKDSDVAGGGVQYATSYTWTKSTAGRNTTRKTGMTMPNARSIAYQYRTTSGLHDSEASRVSAVVDGAVGLALYDYLGTGTVVRTRLFEIGCMSRVIDDSGAIVDLDIFNRISTNRWTKDLTTDRDFYQVALTYDRDSGITSADDAVHGGYDVKYTMDSVNRLTKAEEGTLSAGSITSTTRDEEWTLSHTGNWDVEKLDLDGDLNFNEAGELNDHRTHNVVNELTARDTDNNGSANYSPSYDLVGNMTDDAKDYKYVYDVWGRLRKVKQTGNSADVAEYRYNGLNHRIGVHEDTDTDGDVDSNDKWYYDAFDERWRQLARYRESDSSPKEDFVPHQAGANGNGGSSYVDAVICRNKDKNTAWTTTSDGVLEERSYLCQNWRADVSAVLKLVGSSGIELREWDKYSAYGTPIGLPGGDTDSDTDCDGTDVSQVHTWITGSYDVRGDIDLDGDVDATDESTISGSYSSITLGRGALSASNVANRRGYAGYEALSGLTGGKWLARNRVLATDLGRWLRRDPLGYQGGLNLVTYVSGKPVRWCDPLGTSEDDDGGLAGYSWWDAVKGEIQAGYHGAKDLVRVVRGKKTEIGEIIDAGREAADKAADLYGADKKDTDNPVSNYFRHCVSACTSCQKMGRNATVVMGSLNEAGEDLHDTFDDAVKKALPVAPKKHQGDDDDRDWLATDQGLKCCKKKGSECSKCCDDNWRLFYQYFYPLLPGNGYTEMPQPTCSMLPDPEGYGGTPFTGGKFPLPDK